MNLLLPVDLHRLPLVVAAAVLAASSVWAWRQQPALQRLRSEPVAPHLTGANYEPPDRPPPGPNPTVWPEPPAQSSGRGWLYEVFTPPVIYYNSQARTFTVSSPPGRTGGDDPFGLELLAVKAELYRLQLLGYCGGPGDYWAAFASPGQAETLLAREGRHFAALGLTLKSFAIRKILVEPDPARPVYDVVAFAVLADEKSGADVVLDNRRRKFTDTLLAVLRAPAGTQPPRELHEGDAFSAGVSSYRIERIQLDPPEVVVLRLMPGLSVPETRILRPAAQNNGHLAGTSAPPFPGRPTTAVANHSQ